jgi:hypothetical protein
MHHPFEGSGRIEHKEQRYGKEEEQEEEIARHVSFALRF